MTEDMTPYVGPDLPDIERDRMDKLFPGSWSTKVRRNGPDIIHAFQKVREYYADYITPSCKPRLLNNWKKTWDSRDGDYIEWAIVWEEGPDEWAIRFNHADVLDKTRVFAEPGNGWVLALYRP